MIDRETAERNVIELLRIFPGFCCYGTALGIAREGHILDHDLDTDIAVMSEDFSWAQVSEAVRAGFVIITIYGMRHHGLEVSLERGGIKSDIMVLYRENGKVRNSLWDNGSRNGMSDEIRHEYPAEIIVPITGSLGGSEVKTLGPDYLAHVYGDWKTPVTSWDWRTDHKCRI
jgi:hypothetical protein